jgi:hypothetical protein
MKIVAFGHFPYLLANDAPRTVDTPLDCGKTALRLLLTLVRGWDGMNLRGWSEFVRSLLKLDISQGKACCSNYEKIMIADVSC